MKKTIVKDVRDWTIEEMIADVMSALEEKKNRKEEEEEEE